MRSLLTFLVLFGSGQAFASDLRCKGNIIRAEMTEQELMQFCGAPLASGILIEKQVKYVDDRQEIESKTFREYLMDDGSKSYLFYLLAFGGKITEIKQIQVDRKTDRFDCRKFEFGFSKLLFDHFCGSPTAVLSTKEEIPLKSPSKAVQNVRLQEKQLRDWEGEQWELTFTNGALSNKRKILSNL